MLVRSWISLGRFVDLAILAKALVVQTKPLLFPCRSSTALVGPETSTKAQNILLVNETVDFFYYLKITSISSLLSLRAPQKI